MFEFIEMQGVMISMHDIYPQYNLHQFISFLFIDFTTERLQCYQCNGEQECTAPNVPVTTCSIGQSCVALNFSIGNDRKCFFDTILDKMIDFFLVRIGIYNTLLP